MCIKTVRAALLFLSLFALNSEAALLISEVMGDPSCSEYYNEFIELYNSGPESHEVTDYRLLIDGVQELLLSEAGQSLLTPGERAVILDSGYAEHSDCYETIIPDSVLRLTIADAAFGSNGISNSREVEIGLLLPEGNTGSHLIYPGNGPAGFSWEAMLADTSGGVDWLWSEVEHGTPGCRNSVEPDSFQVDWRCSGHDVIQLELRNSGLLPLQELELELILLCAGQQFGSARGEQSLLLAGDTLRWEPQIPLQGGWLQLQLELTSGEWCDTLTGELLLTGDPSVCINEIMPDPGGHGPEWLELVNADPFLPLNLRDLQLDDNCNDNRAVVTGIDRVLAPTECIVITDDPELMLTCWGELPLLVMSGMPTLGNSEDCLRLFSAADRLLEELAWDANWSIEPGYSLERYNPQLPNNSNSWSRSLSPDRASPGQHNSIRLEQLPATAAHTLSSDLLTPDGDGVDELLVITLQETAWHQQLRVSVYNLTGVCVRKLANGHHGAAVTRLTWNGRNDRGNLLSPGPYLLLVETVAEGGTPRQSRHVVGLYY